MRSYAPVSLALLLVLLTACQAHAAAPSLLTVTCEAPQGVDMSYGSGLLGLQVLPPVTKLAKTTG